MPIGINANTWLLVKNGIALRRETPTPAQHTLLGVCNCNIAGQGANLLASSGNGLVSQKDGLFAAEVSPFAGGSINHGFAVFQSDNSQRFLLGGSMGLALSTGFNPVGVAFTLPAIPAGYRINVITDNNSTNIPDASALGYPYVIFAGGDNGATGAGTGRLLRSTDYGATWTDIALPAGTRDVISVACKGQTVVLTTSGNVRGFFSTDNGLTFTQYDAALVNRPVGITGASMKYGVTFGAAGGGIFIGHGPAGDVVTSYDGLNWSTATLPDGMTLINRLPVDSFTIAGMMTLVIAPDAATNQSGVILASMDGRKFWNAGAIHSASSIFSWWNQPLRTVNPTRGFPYLFPAILGGTVTTSEGLIITLGPFLNPAVGEPG